VNDKVPFDALAQWGTALSAELASRTAELFVPLAPLAEEQRVQRDVAYGPHERQRLDIFQPVGAKNAPILLFVHGGGFVRGDKGGAWSAFYSNVGAWAARHGIVGVTMNYRLAPEFMWPTGGRDVRRAIEWLSLHAAAFGGNSSSIFAMGQSAGAVHVLDMVTGSGEELEPTRLVAGAMMISGIYAPDELTNRGLRDCYYSDPGSEGRAGQLERLATSPIPCLYTVSEHDDADFVVQANLLSDMVSARSGRRPQLYVLKGHNHFSTIFALGTDFDAVGPLVLTFITERSDQVQGRIQKLRGGLSRAKRPGLPPTGGS
jgi:triacylglycerol lipase